MADPAAELHDLYENAPCGYLSLAPDGRIVRANLTLARWLDLAPAELLGRRFHDLLRLPSRIVYETNLAPLIRLQGGFEEVALDFATASGQAMPSLVNAVVRTGPDGQLAETRLAVIRSPDRRSYERDLKAREETAQRGLVDEREVAKLREQFIAVLGHDLRNPLASVVGAARLLRREAQSDKALHVIQMMEASVDRMAGLIDDVMDFARGRLGSGIQVERRPGDLEAVLRQVVAELEAANPSRSIQADIALAEPVAFDEGRIGQLVSNLLGNALTHGDPKGAIRLAALVSDGVVEVFVANGGEPIPEAALPQLFQPFFRGDARPHQQGLGLGLHIASEIARAHGGTLAVASDATETRFTLRMPSA